MPRRSRVVVPETPRHITQRGNNRQPVFFSPADYPRYLQILGKHAVRSGLRLLGYCLMTNHVHLIAVPERETSLAQALGAAHAEYALALNRENGRSGHLWQNRYFSCPLGESRLFAALRYVELNPVRAGMVVAACDWPWSSARAHAGGAEDAILDHNWPERLAPWDQVEWAEILAAGSPPSDCEALRRATWKGEPLGPREFVRGLERRTGRRLIVGERGRPRKRPAPEQEIDQPLLFTAGGW